MIEKIILTIIIIVILYIAIKTIIKMINNIDYINYIENDDDTLGIPIQRTSEHKGVYYDRNRKKWKSKITIKGKCYNMGSFDTEDEAFYALEHFKYENNFDE